MSYYVAQHDAPTRPADSPPTLYHYRGPPVVGPSYPQHNAEQKQPQHQPPEPTPPDSGRSKHFHEFDINRLLARDSRADSAAIDVDDSQRESSEEDSGSSSSSSEEQAAKARGQSLRRRPGARNLDEDFLDGEEELRLRQQRASEWLSSDDEADQRTSSQRGSTRRRRGVPSRKRGTSSSSSSSSRASSSSPGVVWNRVPVRDTPNNPFLGGNDANLARRLGDGARGEDAARAHRRGLITYVFRGQRIVYADAPSDLDEDDEDLRRPDGSQRAPYRFEPKLLFPEAHAAEERRKRQRLRAQQQQEAAERAASARHQGMMSLQRDSRPVTGASTSRFGGNLFAAELQRRQDARASLKRDRAGYEAGEEDEDDGRGAPRPRLEEGGQDHHRDRLLAQLDRVGWSDDDEDRHSHEGEDCHLEAVATRCARTVDEDYDEPAANPFDLAHHFQR